MSNPARMGKTEWRNAIRQAREANADLRALVGRLVRESASPVTQALAGKMALSLVDTEQAINRLDEIARNSEKKVIRD